MSNEELEKLLDENQSMRNQRRWILAAVAVCVVGGALLLHGCEGKPKAETENIRQTWVEPAPRVAEPAAPEPEQQPEQDQTAQAPSGDDDAGGNAAAAAPQSDAGAGNAPAPSNSFAGSLSLGGGNRAPGCCDGWGTYRPLPPRPRWYRRGPFRAFGGGFRRAPAPYRGGFRPAPFRGGFRSFGGGGRHR